MRFYQPAGMPEYEAARFATLDDSNYVRDLGADPSEVQGRHPLELSIERDDERGRPLRPAPVLVPGGSLAFSPSIQDSIAHYLVPWGELLPATLEDAPMVLFHNTIHRDVFDPERSNTSQPRKILARTEVVFRSSAEEFDIVTVSTHPNYGPFFSERLVDTLTRDPLFAGVRFVEKAHTL